MDAETLNAAFRQSMDQTVALSIALLNATDEKPSIEVIAAVVGAAVPDAIARLAERGHIEPVHPA